jgi:hypothetical protein
LGAEPKNQKMLCKAVKLAEERVRRLNLIGFKWDLLDAAWMASFTQLKAH